MANYDYKTSGAYFVTICTKERANILSRIYVGKAALCLPILELSNIGRITEKYINNINVVYDGVTVDKYVIMPNHIHLIIIIDNYGRQRAAFPTLSDIVRSIKILVRKETGKSFFQTSFYDHIIRNEQDYLKIWQYIDTNPAKWSEDRFYIE